jgi:hypothetical protein
VGERKPVADHARQDAQSQKPVSPRAGRIARRSPAGWHIADDGVLAVMLDKYLVYSDFSSEAKSAFDGNKTMSLAPETSGWLLRRQAPDSR